MSTDSRAGTRATAADLVDVEKLLARLPRRPPGPVEPASGRRVRHVRAPRLVAAHHLQRRPHRRHHAGDRRVPHQGGHGRAAVRRRRHARALRAGVADLRRGPGGERRRRARRRGGRLHPHARRCRTRSSPTTAAAPPASRTASSSRPPTTRRRTAASSTTRRTAAPPTRTPRSGSRHGRTSCSRRSWTGCGDGRSTVRGDLGTYDFLGRYVDDLPAVVNLDADPQRRRPDRGGPDGWGQRRVLGRDRRAPRPRPDRRQPRRRPPVRVHDAGLGRQDPHGLLVAVRDGLAGRAPRRVPDRHRQRRRRRPARDRHRRRRADEPQPLPRRGDRLPVREPPRLARATPGSARRPSARR